MISDILTTIYQYSKLIYEQVQMVKANQAQSQGLSERALLVVQAVKRLETVWNSKQYRPVLLAKKDQQKDYTFIYQQQDQILRLNQEVQAEATENNEEKNTVIVLPKQNGLKD